MESMDKFNETSLPAKEKFYSNLHLKNIGDEDYKHAKRSFQIKKHRRIS